MDGGQTRDFASRVDNWNKLPDDVVPAVTISTFKNRLDIWGQIWASKANSLTSPLTVTITVTVTNFQLFKLPDTKP